MWGWGSEGGEGVFGLDGGVGAEWGAGEGFSSETAARDTERLSGGGMCCALMLTGCSLTSFFPLIPHPI